MKITVLVENTTINSLTSEHGLSMFIEFRGKNYLLDAGSTDVFLENTRKLNIGVSDVEACILSHGHYDHSGGFGTYLNENKEVSLYAMRKAGAEYYSALGGMHYIGIPKQILAEHKDRFQLIDDMTEIAEHVYLIPHSTKGLEAIGKRASMYVKRGETYVPDSFEHELSLVFDTEKGLVIFNSCSHGGVQNIIREVQEKLPEKKAYAFLGGLHMKGKQDGIEICTFSEEEIEKLAAYLKEAGLEYLYTGHCTGEPAMRLLEKYMGDQIKRLHTGKVIIL